MQVSRVARRADGKVYALKTMARGRLADPDKVTCLGFLLRSTCVLTGRAMLCGCG